MPVPFAQAAAQEQPARRPHHSHVQPRRFDGTFCKLSDQHLHFRYYALAVRLGRAHPRVVEVAGVNVARLVSVETILERAGVYVSAVATDRYFTGRPARKVTLYGHTFPTGASRPVLWPSGAWWPDLVDSDGASRTTDQNGQPLPEWAFSPADSPADSAQAPHLPAPRTATHDTSTLTSLIGTGSSSTSSTTRSL